MTSAERYIADTIGRVPERIAVFRALYLGDMLLAVPALRSLRAGFPEAEITVIGLPWAETFVDRFRHYVDRFLPFPGYRDIDEIAYDPVRTETFLLEQQEYGYDLAIQMHGSGQTSNRFVLALGARLTAGYYEGEPPSGLDLSASYPHGLHEIERNLGLVVLCGCGAGDTTLDFPLTDMDRVEADGLLTGAWPDEGDDRQSRQTTYPLVGIHPGAKFPSKRWAPERFAEVGDVLAERHGARIVITGGPSEEVIAETVARHMRSQPLVLAGRTSLGGLAGLIDRLDLFISNDTGPAHIAIARATPSIVLFGPVEVHRWRPLNATRHRMIHHAVACNPCGYEICPIDHRCLARIEPDEVVAVAEELLNRKVVECAA